MSKNYLIIGASSGNGLQIAKELNKDDNQLYLASRTEPEIKGENIHYQSIDVTEEFELDLPEKLDGVFYCPGTINLKPFHRLKTQDFLDDFKVNHLGAVEVLQQAQNALKKSDEAAVVLFSTVAVQTGLSFHTSVASAKGAIEGLGKALAAEWAPKIRVNVIAPSLTDTPLAKTLLSSDEKKKSNADRHPLKKLGTPGDIAKAAVFLSSSDAGWITGQVLTIDGGLGSLR
ncbi:MAG: SDR family oxidoreductase [Vicingaceae bacterium]